MMGAERTRECPCFLGCMHDPPPAAAGRGAPCPPQTWRRTARFSVVTSSRVSRRTAAAFLGGYRAGTPRPPFRGDAEGRGVRSVCVRRSPDGSARPGATRTRLPLVVDSRGTKPPLRLSRPVAEPPNTPAAGRDASARVHFLEVVCAVGRTRADCESRSAGIAMAFTLSKRRIRAPRSVGVRRFEVLNPRCPFGSTRSPPTSIVP
jgi:hypothetical protein